MNVMTIIVLGVLLSMALILVRALKGPTIYDRMLAANSFGAKTMVLIVLLAYLFKEPMLLDVALVYAMINFVTTVGVLKYVKYKTFGVK